MSPPPPVRRSPAASRSRLIAQIVVAKFGDHLPLYVRKTSSRRPRPAHCFAAPSATWCKRPLSCCGRSTSGRKSCCCSRPCCGPTKTPVTLLAAGQEGSPRTFGRTSPKSIPTRCTTSRRVAPETDRQTFCKGSKVPHAGRLRRLRPHFFGIERRGRESPVGPACAAQVLRGHSHSPRDTHQLLEWIRQLERHRGSSAHVGREVARGLASSAGGGARAGSNRSYLAQLEPCALPQSVLGQGRVVRSKPVAGAASIHDGASTCRSTTTSANARLRIRRSAERIGCFLGSRQVRGGAAVSSTILARGQGVTGSNLGPTCASCSYACTATIRVSTSCCRPVGRPSPRIRAHLSPRRIRRKAAAKSSRRRHARANRQRPTRGTGYGLTGRLRTA